MKRYLLLVIISMLLVNMLALGSLEEYVVDSIIAEDGSLNELIKVPGGKPPKDYVRKDIVDIQTLKTQRNVVIIDDMPAFDWSYGCSATSAAMIASYYDRNGFPNLYTGPANGGVMPLNNSIWGEGECPLSATHQGIDGLVSRGHVDDYWIESESTNPDPYITGGWTQHTYADCTGDFMGTSQSYWNNSDGMTTFWTNSAGIPLYNVSWGESSETPQKDGAFGFRQFIESRGYEVSTCYNQMIFGYEGNTLGFTFEQFMAEIDANRPVMIHVTGHSMVAFGYNSSDQTIYIKNTWDYSTDTMTWAGAYYGMTHYGVSVVYPDNVNNGDIEVSFNMADGYGDGWKTINGINYLAFKGATITLNSGFTGIKTYYLAPGDYSYTYHENDGYGLENTWTVKLNDNTVLSSGQGTTNNDNGTASQTYYFTVPSPTIAYSNPLPPDQITIQRNWNNSRISWLPVTLDVNGVNISESNVKYRIDMSRDPNFLSGVLQTITSGTSYTHYYALNYEKYFYRVIAYIED